VAFTIAECAHWIQHFKENQFFSNRILKKEYKRIPTPSAESDKPDEHGITDSMLDFSWDRDVEMSVSSLDCCDS
jgi:template-activating factor I